MTRQDKKYLKICGFFSIGFVTLLMLSMHTVPADYNVATNMIVWWTIFAIFSGIGAAASLITFAVALYNWAND